MSVEHLKPGDPVFHPRGGFGIVESVIEHAPSELAIRGDGKGSQRYYNIKLTAGGTLMVPVERAGDLGLRRLDYGVHEIEACLCLPPGPLPEEPRERADMLRERAQAAADVLAATVRDLLALAQEHELSRQERTWLERTYDLLSTEAAMVDRISMYEARTAILEVVSGLVPAEDSAGTD